MWRSYWKPVVAIPQEHGAWVFLLSPLLIGFVAGRRFAWDSLWLTLVALAAFFLRQPLTVLVKVHSGRRPRGDLPAARFWIVVYGLLALGGLAILITKGFTFLLFLAVPAGPVFAWHLYLVSKRAERKQPGVEIVATGVLALVAPAAFWIGQGRYEPMGWMLWLLSWLQSAASIVYAYLRLDQRRLTQLPPVHERLRMARRTMLYTTFNMLLVLGLSLGGVLPKMLWTAYAVQWLESLWGSLIRPAIGWKPTRIGFRQLVVSSLFTCLFLLTWVSS